MKLGHKITHNRISRELNVNEPSSPLLSERFKENIFVEKIITIGNSPLRFQKMDLSYSASCCIAETVSSNKISSDGIDATKYQSVASLKLFFETLHSVQTKQQDYYLDIHPRRHSQPFLDLEKTNASNETISKDVKRSKFLPLLSSPAFISDSHEVVKKIGIPPSSLEFF